MKAIHNSSLHVVINYNAKYVIFLAGIALHKYLIYVKSQPQSECRREIVAIALPTRQGVLK